MNLNESLKIAENAHRQKNFKLAEQSYLTIITDFNSNDAIFGLATLYMHMKKFDKAIKLFITASTNEPFAIDIALNFAMCLQAANECEQALTVINNIKRHLPNDAYIINSFANIAIKIQSPILAIELLNKYPSTNIETQNMIAQAHMQLKNWSKALIIWNKLAVATPQKAIFYQNKSICHAKLREYDLAISAFEIFINKTQQSSNNFLKFSDLYMLSRDIVKARKQLNIAISLNDTSLTRYEIEIRICRLENNNDCALRAADNALKINPNCYIAWGVKQEIGNQNNETIQQLASLMNEPISNSYENQQNLFILAKAYEKNTQYQKAFQSFKKANQLQEKIIKNDGLNYDFQKAATYTKFLTSVYTTLPKKENVKAQNIFIVGMPRSGTTLMDRILSQHPNVLSSGENEALALFIENKINQQQQSNKYDWNDFFSQNAQNIRHNYIKKTALTSEIIIDKMPHNFRYVGAIISIFEQPKIIQMRRTPEDLALSIFSQPFAPHHNYAANLKTIAHAIFHANKLMDFWRDHFPEYVIDVDYNQLTYNPANISSEIFKFCHLTWQNEYLNFHKKHVNSFTFSELQVRQPINTKKQNFSRHYKQELLEFSKYYAELSQSIY